MYEIYEVPGESALFELDKIEADVSGRDMRKTADREHSTKNRRRTRDRR